MPSVILSVSDGIYFQCRFIKIDSGFDYFSPERFFNKQKHTTCISH